jgi:hypothetical protein
MLGVSWSYCNRNSKSRQRGLLQDALLYEPHKDWRGGEAEYDLYEPEKERKGAESIYDALLSETDNTQMGTLNTPPSYRPQILSNTTSLIQH